MTKNSEIAFPEAGEGVSLHFRAADLAAMQTAFGPDYFKTAAMRCDALDIAFIVKAVEVAGRKDGEPFDIDLDEVDAPLSTVAGHVIEALYSRVFGVGFGQRISERALAYAAIADRID